MLPRGAQRFFVVYMLPVLQCLNGDLGMCRGDRKVEDCVDVVVGDQLVHRENSQVKFVTQFRRLDGVNVRAGYHLEVGEPGHVLHVMTADVSTPHDSDLCNVVLHHFFP